MMAFGAGDWAGADIKAILKRSFTHMLFLSVALVVTWLPCAYANDSSSHSPIFVIGAHLEGRLNGKDAGYDKLIRRVMPADQGMAVFQRYPLVRALRSFEQIPRSCLFPASINATATLTSVPEEELIQSEGIDFVSVFPMPLQKRWCSPSLWQSIGHDRTMRR